MPKPTETAAQKAEREATEAAVAALAQLNHGDEPVTDQPVETVVAPQIGTGAPNMAVEEPPLDVPTPEDLEANSDLLSPTELEEIKAEALQQFTEGRKKEARAKAIKSELARLHRAAGGDVVDGPMGDLVSIVVDLPENSNEIIWNQERIANGSRLTRPRHVIAGLLDTMWRGAVAQHNLDGKTREEFYRRQQPIMVSKKSATVLNSDQTTQVS